MDVTLHIGAHRTATTSLQHHLASHRRRLEADGVVYWGPKITRGGLFNGIIGGALPVLPWQKDRAAKRLALRLEGLRQEGHRALLISDENMIGSLRATLEDLRLYSDAGARVAAHSVGATGHRLTIAMSVRRYDDWWASAVAFRLGRGGPVPVTRLRERFVTQPRRWRHIIEDIANAHPEADIVVWPYETMAGRADVVTVELTGVETPKDTSGRKNQRPSATHLHKVMEDCGMRCPKTVDGTFMPFLRFEAEALRAQYDEDLEWLADGGNGRVRFVAPPEGDGDADENQASGGRTPLAETGMKMTQPAQRVHDGHGRGSADDGDTQQLA